MLYLYGIFKNNMKTIIQYTTINSKKNNRLQHFLKEVSDVSVYQKLQEEGVIWDLEIITL
jgi:hypothetical protein